MKFEEGPIDRQTLATVVYIHTYYARHIICGQAEPITAVSAGAINTG